MPANCVYLSRYWNTITVPIIYTCLTFFPFVAKHEWYLATFLPVYGASEALVLIGWFLCCNSFKCFGYVPSVNSMNCSHRHRISEEEYPFLNLNLSSEHNLPNNWSTLLLERKSTTNSPLCRVELIFLILRGQETLLID